MKLRTKIDVDYNTGRVVGNAKGKVTMTLTGGNQVFDANGNQTMEVGYDYTEADGTPIKSGVFKIADRKTMDALYEAVKDILPPFTTKSQRFLDEVTAGGKFEMATTFGINMSDIEEVKEVK